HRQRTRQPTGPDAGEDRCDCAGTRPVHVGEFQARLLVLFARDAIAKDRMELQRAHPFGAELRLQRGSRLLLGSRPVDEPNQAAHLVVTQRLVKGDATYPVLLEVVAQRDRWFENPVEAEAEIVDVDVSLD